MILVWHTLCTSSFDVPTSKAEIFRPPYTMSPALYNF